MPELTIFYDAILNGFKLKDEPYGYIEFVNSKDDVKYELDTPETDGVEVDPDGKV